MEIQDVIAELGKLIEREKGTEDSSWKSWGMQVGILLSLDEAICIYEELTKANSDSVGNDKIVKQ